MLIELFCACVCVLAYCYLVMMALDLSVITYTLAVVALDTLISVIICDNVFLSSG